MIPIILDTDLGTDIDDHWAIAHVLGCPELDVKLMTVVSGDTTYRARLLTALLTAAGRTDIPIGLGRSTDLIEGVPLHMVPDVARTHPLAEYGGTVFPDAADAIIDTVHASPDPVTILSIGPVTNLADTVARDPSVTTHSRLISMAAFVRGGILGVDSVAQPEYNVAVDVPAFRRILESDWDLTLAPVDSCGLIRLDGDRYASLRTAPSPLLREVLVAYREWYANFPLLGGDPASFDPDTGTTTLCDTLPAYLAYAEGAVELETIRVSIGEDGVVAESSDGRLVRAAMRWRDRDAFLDELTERLRGAD